MNFEEAVKIILELEGGERIVDDPQDPGGLTRWGISLRAHPDLGENGVRNLTEVKAKEIYWNTYWKPLGLSDFWPELRLALFDSAVNHGPRQAVRFLQQAINDFGFTLLEDGILGPKTRAATLASMSRSIDVLVEFMHRRLEFYRSLATYSRFGRGWQKRVLTILFLASKRDEKTVS